MTTAKQQKATRRIEEILRNRCSTLANSLIGVENIVYLTYCDRKKIVEELGNEFCEKGLGLDDEPNDYGFEIEDLIDACGLTRDDGTTSGK